MELWFIYAITGTFLIGLLSFSSKISVEKNHNPSLVTLYASVVSTLFGVGYFFMSDNISQNLGLELALGAVNGLFYLCTTLTRIESLRYIDTSVYFPIYKAIGPILLLFITILFFGETFTLKESIGIALGIFVPLLLISKHSKNKNMKKGLAFMFIGLITAIISSMAIKFSSIYNVNLLLVSVYSLFFQTMGAYVLLKIRHKENSSFGSSKIKRLGIISGVINFGAFYLFILAVDLSGSLGLVYVLQSLYIVIPIALSIIIYKEHFDLKKFIAIILTIASIYFMK